MDNLLFDIRPPDKIVERAMVIRFAVLQPYCSVTRGISARFGVEYADSQWRPSNLRTCDDLVGSGKPYV